MQATTNKKRIYLAAPHMSGNEQKYVNEAFATNWIAPLGPNVDAFEKDIALHVGANEAVAVSSGTAAIHLALSLLGVEMGDVVFCSTFTFVASANPILYQGAAPVFIDSEPETWNMSPYALRKALEDYHSSGNLPKAVIVVNLYGQSAKMDEILSLCDEYGVPVIEDAAESLGSTYKGKASGTFGKYGIYSFNGNKIITTSGGGMLISDDRDAMAKARFLATQARDEAVHYQHSQMGFNYRMSNVLAGIGRGQLEVLEERVLQKRAIFQYYEKELSHLPGVTFMPEMEDTVSNRWLTAVLIDEEKAGVSASNIVKLLAEENIEARPVWKPLHLQPLFSKTAYYPHEKDFSVSEELFAKGICLPSGTNMSVEEKERVANVIKSALIKSKSVIMP